MDDETARYDVKSTLSCNFLYPQHERGHFDAEYEAIIRAETTMTSPLNVCKVGLNEQSILRCCVQIIISKVPLSVLSVDVYLQDQKQPQRGSCNYGYQWAQHLMELAWT